MLSKFFQLCITLSLALYSDFPSVLLFGEYPYPSEDSSEK